MDNQKINHIISEFGGEVDVKQDSMAQQTIELVPDSAPAIITQLILENTPGATGDQTNPLNSSAYGVLFKAVEERLKD